MAAEAEFCLLGPLLVRRGGAVVPVAAGKQRVLLAALLLSANQVVSVDELDALLWGDAPPASARATLQNYVKRLRQALAGTGGSRIRTLPQGYLITVAPDELDLSRFEALLGRARQAADEGAWDRAVVQLRTALSLWRGKPLADVPSELLAEREVPRLAEMRLQAIEARIDADLHLGRHADVIAELRQLASVHPLRERLHALLMLALYRDGQQAAALAAYQRARRVLIEELGSEPWPGLRRLQHQILTADPALHVPEPAPAGPRMVVPRQLPAPVAHFAGRARELKALTGMLDEATADGGTVVISAIGGTAGVGKTALAVHWAHQVTEWFPDGQLYVDLRGFGPSGKPVAAADAVRRFLDALQVPAGQVPASPEAQQDLYRSLLAGRRMLIVLDNARDAAQVRPLLAGGPGGLVLVTSRNQLTSLVAAEGAHPVSLDVLSPQDARELLERRLGAERVMTEPEALDHYLHTANAAARILHPERDVLALTARQPGVMPEEFGDYEQAMGWFEAEYRVLLVAVAHADGEGFGTHAWQLPMALTTFLDRRGHWHDLIASLRTALAAAERLGDPKAMARARSNLGHAHISLGSYQDAIAHYEQALAWHRQLGDRAGQGRVHIGIGFCLSAQGHHREAIAHSTRALQLYRAAGNRSWEAVALNNIGWCHAELGDHQQALACAEQALALHQETGYRQGEAHAWDSIGHARHGLGQYPEAVACYRRALAIFEEQGNRFYQAEVLIHVGDARDADGRPLAARKTWRRALAILGDLDHPRADEIRTRLRQDALAART